MRLLLFALLASVPAASAASAGSAVPAGDHTGADTVVVVQSGDRVVFEAREGRVTVEGVSGDRLEIDDQGQEGGVRLVRRGHRLEVAPRLRGARIERSVRLRVPDGVAVEINGHDVEVEARSLDADVRVRTVEGDLRVVGVRGAVDLQTVDGDIFVEEVEGALAAATVDGRVHVERVQGRVAVESMDGDIRLDDVDGDEIVATTVDGDVYFRGPLSAGSRVRLVTHDGNVVAVVPPDASADVEVSTFDGEFMPGFPVRVGRVEAGQPLRFRLGSGAAQLDIQVFDGDIQLRQTPER